MAKLGDTLTTRDALRTAVADDIVGRAQTAAVAMEGGPLDGIAVVSMDTLRQVVVDSLSVKLPPPSDKVAEVTTPAVVTVSALCPECGLPASIAVTLRPRLTVEGNTTELAVKAKSKAIVHMHGQLPLVEAPGQETVEYAIENLRARILGAIADVGDAIPEVLPTLEAIADRLEWTTEDQRSSLDDTLYQYREGDDPHVELVSKKGQPPTYVLTDSGIAWLAAHDAATAAEDDDEGEDEPETDTAA